MFITNGLLELLEWQSALHETDIPNSQSMDNMENHLQTVIWIRCCYALCYFEEKITINFFICFSFPPITLSASSLHLDKMAYDTFTGLFHPIPFVHVVIDIFFSCRCLSEILFLVHWPF